MMPDREKVIKGLEICKNSHGRCAECPYDDGDIDFTNCTSILCGDALALLKEQKAIVRCKDCKHYKWLIESCDHVGGSVAPDWFCADGERK